MSIQETNRYLVFFFAYHTRHRAQITSLMLLPLTLVENEYAPWFMVLLLDNCFVGSNL